jgi:hypothetical protein
LEHFFLSHNPAVTNRGFISLAQAIDACGLPKLEKFRLTGLQGPGAALDISTIARAVINSCPDLYVIECDQIHRQAVMGLVEVAGRAAQITVR